MSALERIWEQTPPVTRNLLALTIVMGLADWVLARFGVDLDVVFGLVSWDYAAFSFRHASFHLWQPITYMFMHAGFWHWFCNMFAVWMFGMVLEREWGWKKYLTYYLVCGVGAALVQELTWMLASPGQPGITIGASGAVFGVLLAFAWLFPQQNMYLMFIPIPIPSRVFVAIYALFELLSGVAGFQVDVAHFAHLGGMLFGALLIWWWQYRDKHPRPRFKEYKSKDYSDYHFEKRS